MPIPLGSKIKSCLPKAAFVLALAAAVTAFVLPYLVNSKYLIATAGDNNFYSFHVMLSHPERFAADMMGIIGLAQARSSLLHLAGIWILDAFPVDPAALYNVCIVIQLVTLPLLLLIPLRHSLKKTELFSAFLLILSCGFLFWNVDLHGGQGEFPYPAEFSFPFFWLGLWWITRGKVRGYFVLALGCLIHASYGLYSITAALILHLMDRKSLKVERVFFLLIPLACAVLLPSLELLTHFKQLPAADKLTDKELWAGWRLNTHGAPWDDLTVWPFALPSSVALGFLAAVSWPWWDKFGRAYRNLLLAACLTFVLFGTSHLVGFSFRIIRLLQMIGLRSETLFVIFYVPVLVLFFKDTLRHPRFFIRFAAAWIVLVMVFAQPYGFDKVPVLLLGLALWTEKIPSREGSSLRFLKWVPPLLMLVWLPVWLFHRAAVEELISPKSIIGHWGLADYFKFNWPVDFCDNIRRPETFFILASSLLLAVWPLAHKIPVPWIRKGASVSPLVLLIPFLALAFGQMVDAKFKDYGSQYKRDLYDAQMWAKANTDPKARFLYFENSWRTLSERSIVSLRPKMHYLYVPDRRAKDIDDKVIQALGLEKVFQNGNRKTFLLATDPSFRQKFSDPNELRRLGKFLNVDYLIDVIMHPGLKLVYFNRSLRIFNLSKEPS